MHMVDKVNRDVNGLNWNPSSNKVDITRAHCHRSMDLETIPRWHAFPHFAIYYDILRLYLILI
jgi:hypothetical protein